jgi:GNAT superfamily N-acetyltransferase
MEIYHVDQVWQLADVFSIRRQTKIHGEVVDKRGEFDDQYPLNKNYILVEENDIPVGTARLNFNNDNFAKIERVSIAEPFQKQGYGRQLIEAAEKWVVDKGFGKIVITSLDTAVGFYQKLGYQVNRDIAINSDHPIVYMEKQTNVNE